MSAAPYVLGTIATLAAIRTLFRPHRAIVREGAIARCPGGSPCDPTLAVDTPAEEPVFATAPGRVVAIGQGYVHIAARSDPVILYYDGVLAEDGLVEGQYVGGGQRIGRSTGRIFFGVMEFAPGGEAYNVDPSSWLASRGQRIAARYTGPGTAWCEESRHVSVPRSAGAACQLHEPDRAKFALLPVTVEIER
jgi:hypothetical protein